MQRQILNIAITLLLTSLAGFAFALEPNQDGNNPPVAVRQIQPRRFRAEPNQPGDANRPQMDQLRQQARERMRRRAMEGMMNQQRMRDGNIPEMNAAARERLESRRGPMMTPNTMNREAMIQQRKAAMEEGISQIEISHRQRIAQLNRISELAKQQGDTETAAKADSLLEKETKQHQNRLERLEHRKNMMIESANRPPLIMDMNRPVRPRRQDVNQPK